MAQTMKLSDLLINHYKNRIQDMDYQYGLGCYHTIPIRRMLAVLEKKQENSKQIVTLKSNSGIWIGGISGDADGDESSR